MVSKLEKKAPAFTQPKSPLAAPAKPTPAQRLGAGDALSTGRGRALRSDAMKKLGATGLSVSDAPAMKLSDLLKARNASVAFARQPEAAGPAATSVANAARDVQTAWNSSCDPKTRDAAVTEAIEKGAAQFAGDPVAAAQYAAAIAPTVTSLAADLGARKNDKSAAGLLKRLGKASDSLGPEAALSLGASVAAGLPDTKDLFYLDDVLKGSSLGLGVLVGLTSAGKLDSANNLAGSIFSGLKDLPPGLVPAALGQIPPELAGPLSLALAKLGQPLLSSILGGVALGPVDAATTAASQANANVDRLQNDLNLELEHVPLEDQKAFQAGFWASHQGELDAATAAEANLKTVLDSSLPLIKQLAADNPKVAAFLANSLGVLAHDPAQADFVTSTIDGLRVGGKFPASFAKSEDALVSAYSSAQQGVANLLIAEGDTAGAAAVLDKTLTFLETTKFFTQDLNELKKPLENFVEVLSSGDLPRIKEYLTTKENPDLLAIGKGNKTLTNLIAGVSVAVALVDGVDKGADVAGTLQAVLSVAGPATDLLASGFEVLAGAVKQGTLKTTLTSATELTQALSEGIGKITGVIGVVTGVISTFGSAEDAIHNPNLQTIAIAVGSTLTTIGGALALFPGGQAVGGLISVVGGATEVVAIFIGQEEADADRHDETVRLLQQVFAQPGSPASTLSAKDRTALAQSLADSSVDLEALRKDAGLSYAQLADLAIHTNTLSFESAEGWSLGDVASALGLGGDALVKFLKAHRDDFIDQVGKGWEPTGLQAFDFEKAVTDLRDQHPKWTDAQISEAAQAERATWRFNAFKDWVKEVAQTSKK